MTVPENPKFCSENVNTLSVSVPVTFHLIFGLSYVPSCTVISSMILPSWKIIGLSSSSVVVVSNSLIVGNVTSWLSKLPSCKLLKLLTNGDNSLILLFVYNILSNLVQFISLVLYYIF